MSKSIMSQNVTTRNVVLHITVPKRTGRRRKKGSDGPWVDPAGVNPQLSRGRLDYGTNHLLRSLQDNEDNYEAKPVGVIEHTHRFRGESVIYITNQHPKRDI